MSKALNEYKNFLRENKDKLSDHEKKLSNIILDNFSDVELSKSNGGKRGKLIAELISKYGDSVESSLSLDDFGTMESNPQIVGLSKLRVNNFRGFLNEHTFDFKNPLTFVYGPNGTGKSSLCEALEYSLLGTIHEAEAKRIKLSNYIKNVDSKSAEAPVLTGIDTKGYEMPLEPDPQSNEFCFIERNRIEGFARVSANTAQAQQQRLAALFGLEDFNSFATNFNEHFEKYLDCKGKKAEQLSEREEQIVVHKKELESIPQKRDNHKKQTDELLDRFPGVKSLADLKEYLSGSEENQGLIHKNNKDIASLKSLKPQVDSGIIELKDNIEHLFLVIEKRNATRESLEMYKEELSLKDMYEAILNSKDRFKEYCPACESNLYIDGELAVPVDPYANAINKLDSFEKAIQIETNVYTLEEQISQSLELIKTRFTDILLLAESTDFPEKDVISAMNQQISDKGNNLYDAVSTIHYQLDVLPNMKEHVVEHNKKAEKAHEQSKHLKDKNEQLNNVLEEIAKVNADIKSLDTTEESAKSAIDQFELENKQLIEEVENEKSVIESNQKFHEAYISLKTRLEEHNRQLPSSLAANLNTKTLEFYNAINRYDHPSDHLEKLELPDSSGKKIQIRFKGGQDLDALHVLSEGHLRCLGLSILLAKNVQENLPFVIFDDVVNAIDDEHRRGIAETLLEDSSIGNKQLIITTHGEEFVKQLENNIPNKEYPKKVSRIDFLRPTVSNEISIKLDLPRNYLVLARKRLEEGQVRDALANGRRAFEDLLNRLWKRINKIYSAQISVSMRIPDRPPELMSIATGLKKYISKNNVEAYESVVPLLENMLGKGQKHTVEWNYLNKGTHEEERVEEFDSTIVNEILNILERIDDTIYS